MTEKNRGGRPPKAPEDRRSEHIAVRVTPALRSQIQFHATMSERTLGAEAERAISETYRREDQDIRKAGDFMFTLFAVFHDMTAYLGEAAKADLDPAKGIAVALQADTGRMNALTDMAVLFFDALQMPDGGGNVVSTRERWQSLDESYLSNLKDQVTSYLHKTEDMGSRRWNLRAMLKVNGHPGFQEDLIHSRETIGPALSQDSNATKEAAPE